jgi:hypothetical protein
VLAPLGHHLPGALPSGGPLISLRARRCGGLLPRQQLVEPRAQALVQLRVAAHQLREHINRLLLLLLHLHLLL